MFPDLENKDEHYALLQTLVNIPIGLSKDNRVLSERPVNVALDIYRKDQRGKRKWLRVKGKANSCIRPEISNVADSSCLIKKRS